MSDKEAILELIRNLPAEVSLREIVAGIENFAVSTPPLDA
jgi:hypothetical protein